MPVVTSKKKPSKAKPVDPTDHVVTFRVPPELFSALETYRAKQLYPPDRTAVLLRLLEQFLCGEGLYPPRKPSA